MTKRNPYLQHTYESFDQPSAQRRAPQNEGFEDGPSFTDRLRSPVVATIAVLLAGAALAGIIAISYPSKKTDDNLPVITADAAPLREAPSDPGGMQVANSDSTVYNSIRSADTPETPPIENLLSSEQPVDAKKALVDQNTAAASPDASAAASIEPSAGSDAATSTTPPSEMVDATATAAPSTTEAGAASSASMADIKKTPVTEQTIPMAAADSAEKPALRPAGSNPETLAYVRSVLDNKETAPGEPAATTTTTASAASSPAAIEPAAGAASPGAAKAIKPGSYYVQLASIASESAAPKEWTKLQKSFSSLSGVDYRVQKAALAKGTFYRIQAGPMSKDSAKSVCDSIKAQKPGGCIIVQ